ncbi:MAG: hypothetical protein Q8930_06265 [Bacillota bacterium]|nr:hypothetical protein [Bacillota bacterium]
MRTADFLGKVNLLWPDEACRDARKRKDGLSEDSCRDIGLDSVVNEYSVTGVYREYVKSLFTEMCEDVEVIHYRQDIIDDMICCPEVESGVRSILAIACEVEAYSRSESVTTPDVLKLVKSFRETDLYGSCISRAREIILRISDKIKSKGLCLLRDEILKLSDKFTGVYPDVETKKENEYVKPASITLGINLDSDLRPMEATFISVNDSRYTRAPFLNRLMRNNGEFESIYEFHPSEEGGLKERILEELEEASGSLVRIDSTALQLSLISDLDRIMKNTISPLRTIIYRYTNTYSKFFVELRCELLFFVGSVNLIQRLKRAGLPMTRPKIHEKEKRVLSMQGLYNINLALKSQEDRLRCIVQNDLDFDEEGSIFILTGPNSGGKTTYINAAALIQVLAQAGMYVPASSADISPVDNIYTHFTSEEKKDTDYGRLGEEAERLRQIFNCATKYSLIVLNESLSSTSPGECLYMSRDIVTGLKYLDAKAIFATHLHELALELDKVNSCCRGKGVIRSLVAGTRKQQDSSGAESYMRTYKVMEAPPQGLSYAKDIAESFGISFEQIEKLLDERFVI